MSCRKPAATRSTPQISRKPSPKYVGIPIKKIIHPEGSTRSSPLEAARIKIIQVIATMVPTATPRRLILSDRRCMSFFAGISDCQRKATNIPTP